DGDCWRVLGVGLDELEPLLEGDAARTLASSTPMIPGVDAFGGTTHAWHERAAAGLVALLLAAFPVRARQPAGPLAGFDAYAKAALADWRTPGMAIAIVKDGKVVFARGHGVRRVGEKDLVDEHTVFPIASVTKVFTATCLVQLVEEGRLKWSDP